jgi:Asp/Glu/hydantoin racemase
VKPGGATSGERQDGAGVIVMGCAGMAVHRRGLERELGIPVIDPTQAAVAIFDFARHRRPEHYGRITAQTGVVLPE